MFDENTAPIPSTLERQQALDVALRSFSTPTVINGLKANTIQGIPGRGYTDNPEVVDESTEESVVLSEAEGEPLEEETQLNEGEPEEESEGLSEGFTAEFEKAFGIPPTEAIETFNSLLAFRNEVLLMQEWNVTPGEYRSRMEEVKGFYEGLPEEGKSQFNTPEGAIAIWNHLHPDGQPKARGGVKANRKTTKTQTKPTFLFTKSQILQMSPEQFRANAAAIQQAYNTGRVNENA